MEPVTDSRGEVTIGILAGSLASGVCVAFMAPPLEAQSQIPPEFNVAYAQLYRSLDRFEARLDTLPASDSQLAFGGQLLLSNGNREEGLL